VLILKLNFSKSFDTIEHQKLSIFYVVGVLMSVGLNGCKLYLIQLSPECSSMVFWVKKFPCRRGVRQGDPFSPILFVARADLLQSMVNSRADAGVLIPPLPIPNAKFPIVQYVDDTLLILEACPIQFAALKNLLQTFAAATGIKVNYSKSCLLPINVSD
jgi:hypothetical protein